MTGAEMLDLGRALWGPPNMSLSTKGEARFGTNGSKSIDLKKLVWYDHEANTGGGCRDLYHKVFGVWPENGARTSSRQVAWYDYRDEAGTLLFQVVRFDPKDFRQRRPDASANGGWTWKIEGVRRVLYRLPELLAAPVDATVYIVEGEKDVDQLRALGLHATCNMGGAADHKDKTKPYRGKWRRDYSEYLRRRHVVILPDNDATGSHHARDMAAKLTGIAASIRILELPDLQPKGDVSDWLAAGGTVEELERLARDTPVYVSPPPSEEPPPDTPPGDGRPLGPGDKPIIRCVPGELPRMAREAEAAIIAAGVEVYQRHKLVRPIEEEYDAADGRKTHSAALLAFTAASLCKLLSNVATLVKYSRQQESWVKCDPPDRLVSILLDGRGDWTVPHVRGVLTCPTLRPDGSVLAERCFDAKSRYYLALPSNLVMPEIPSAPTREDAMAALDRQRALLARFPFVDTVSEAVAHCILMTQPLRCAMECCPLLAVSANAPGSGKSFLIDLASAIALGRPCPIIPPGKDENETEKAIRTKLLSSTPAFSVDNVHAGLNLPLLNQATERTHISIRLFNVLEEVEVENSVVIFMTGNNLSIIDEQGRRTLRCQIDVTGDVRPEFRTFDFNPIDTVMADRGRYIADVLIIAKAYAMARANGEPRPDIPPMGDSHKAWSRLVREPLVWLGCEDPIMSQEITRQSDPVANTLGAIIDAWHIAFGMGAHTLAEAAKYATTIPVLRADYSDKQQNVSNEQNYHAHKASQEGLLAALRDGFAAGKDGVDTHKWGQWMRKLEGRQSGGLRFVKAKEEALSHKVLRWRLSK